MKEKIKYIPYLIIIVVSVVVVISLFNLNWSDFNEARIHISRIVSVKEIIKDGIFPSLISYKHMMNFGYAVNIFYGPLTTYIPILISLFTKTLTMALKIFTLLTVILSGITMYNFIHAIIGKQNKKGAIIALIGALIYITAPYKLTDIYSRNAVGEYTSFIFIPMVFHGMYEMFHGNNKKHYLIIIGAVGLILSHTITTIYTVLFALFYLLFNTKKLKNVELLKKIGIDILLIILLTAFYLVPLIEHKLDGNYTIYDAEEMGATGRYVFQNTIGIKEWFNSEFGSQEIVHSFGIVIIITLLLTPFCIKKTKKYSQYKEFWALALVSLWMCTKIFPWILMPRLLTIIQFAWRLNGFFIFFIAYICSVNVVEFSEVIKDKHQILSIIIMIIICICTIFGTKRYIVGYSLEKELSYETILTNREALSPYSINRDYLPINALYNIEYIQKRENKTYVLNGQANIESEEKNKLHSEMNISNIENATLELPYIYYHGYTVKLNGTALKTYESKNGFLCVDVNEEGELTVNYTGTIIEKIGYIISSITIISSMIYLITRRRQCHIIHHQ